MWLESSLIPPPSQTVIADWLTAHPAPSYPDTQLLPYSVPRSYITAQTPLGIYMLHLTMLTIMMVIGGGVPYVPLSTIDYRACHLLDFLGPTAQHVTSSSPNGKFGIMNGDQYTILSLEIHAQGELTDKDITVASPGMRQ